MSTTVQRGKRWKDWLAALILIVMLIATAVPIAIALRNIPAVEAFIEQFPGEYELPQGAPVGFPPWLGWQHFLNAFFLLMIIRSGWQVRTQLKPPAYWTRRNSGPMRSTGAPKRISITLWFHLSLDALWIINGVLFVALLFATGQWMRVVPTSWEVLPNALSAAIQYASMDWPTENGWVNYNSLQQLAYFTTIFLAVPLAIITGIRMSPAWTTRWKRASAMFPIEWARRVHLPLMFYFLLFTIAHVSLVLATGALRNLNHMYGSNDGTSWVGTSIFAASALVMTAAWLLARPILLRPIASLTGTVSR